jgi:hypothetical protein
MAQDFRFRSVDRRRLQCVQRMFNLILAIPKIPPFVSVPSQLEHLSIPLTSAESSATAQAQLENYMQGVLALMQSRDIPQEPARS